MMVYRFPVGQLEANCFFVICDKTNQAVVIDPGDEGSFLSEKILTLGIKPKFIILTHGHFDHLMAAEELRLNFKAPILIHQNDLFLLKKAARYTLLPPKKQQFVQEGEMIEFGQEKLKVIHTPGHTPGSICLYNQKQKLLFSGDLLFKDGVGRTDFSYSSIKELENSLKTISSLPPKTMIYPGHGEKFISEFNGRIGV